MKAIETRYLPATSNRPSRVVATAEGGNRIVIPWDHDLNDHEAVYRKAAEALCKKMNWPGELIGGGTKNGYCFVFKP